MTKRKPTVMDDHHMGNRKKRWDRWRMRNWPRIAAAIPANRQAHTLDALKQAFYAGYVDMYKETD